jgi:hypothetical protein
MNHKSHAACPHCGKDTKWGTCTTKKSNGQVCGSKGFPYEGGGKYYCVACKTIYESKSCEHCGKEVPSNSYKASGFLSALFGG